MHVSKNQQTVFKLRIVRIITFSMRLEIVVFWHVQTTISLNFLPTAIMVLACYVSTDVRFVLDLVYLIVKNALPTMEVTSTNKFWLINVL